MKYTVEDIVLNMIKNTIEKRKANYIVCIQEENKEHNELLLYKDDKYCWQRNWYEKGSKVYGPRWLVCVDDIKYNKAKDLFEIDKSTIIYLNIIEIKEVEI